MPYLQVSGNDKRPEIRGFVKIAGVLRGNTIRGNRTRNSERKMALWEELWEGIWKTLKTSENLWKPLKTLRNFLKTLPLRDPLRGRCPSQSHSGLLPLIVLPPNLSPRRGEKKNINIQRSPNPPEFAQPRLSRSNGNHPQWVCSYMAGIAQVWGYKFGCVWSVSFRPTQTGLCKSGGVWSSLKHTLFGSDARRENPRERAAFPDPESLCQALLYWKTQGIPNINFSEHKILAAPRLAFQKFMLKKFMLIFSVLSSRSYQSSVTPLFQGTKAPITLVYCVLVQSERGGWSVTDLCWRPEPSISGSSVVFWNPFQRRKLPNLQNWCVTPWECPSFLEIDRQKVPSWITKWILLRGQLC